MKKFILILMLATFMLVPNVNAASIQIQDPLEYGASILPQSCSDNILKLDFSNLMFINGSWYYDDSPSSISGNTYFANNYFIEIKSNTEYYHYSSTSESWRVYHHFFDENFEYISSASIAPNKYFTTPSNAKYSVFGLYTSFSGLTQRIRYKHMIYEYKGAKLDYVDYEQCPVITADTTLDNFYSIYVSKLKEFSEYALENKYILGTLAIILLFIILEIILNLFRKGGFR